MTGIVDDVLSITDEILGLRDELGAIKHKIYLLTRTWTGAKRGDGTPSDIIVQVLPTPYLVDYSHSLRVREGGAVKQGDVMLKMISKQSYTEKQIDCSVDLPNLEKWYYINQRLYEVISVVDDYVYYNVQLRKTIKQTVYL